MSDETEVPARTGSYADLARRVDRVEQTVANLQGTVSRVEINQEHAEELNKLRFEALNQSVAGIGATLATFITRIEGIVSGEVQTAQTRQGAEMVSDYLEWRRKVDARLPDEEFDDWRANVDTFLTQGKLLGRLVTLAVAGNAIAIIAGIAAFLKP